jgi:hypothetical protein
MHDARCIALTITNKGLNSFIILNHFPALIYLSIPISWSRCTPIIKPLFLTSYQKRFILVGVLYIGQRITYSSMEGAVFDGMSIDLFLF